MRPSFASLRRVTNPRPSSVVITPVAVGRLIPTAAAKSRASISPHTHSTQRPTNAVHERRSGARTFDSMWRRIAAEVRNTFEIAHIARKSSGRSPSSSTIFCSAGEQRRLGRGRALPVHAALPSRAMRSPSSRATSRSASTSSSLVRKFTKHGRSQTSPSISADAR